MYNFAAISRRKAIRAIHHTHNLLLLVIWSDTIVRHHTTNSYSRIGLAIEITIAHVASTRIFGPTCKLAAVDVLKHQCDVTLAKASTP